MNEQKTEDEVAKILSHPRFLPIETRKRSRDEIIHRIRTVMEKYDKVKHKAQARGDSRRAEIYDEVRKQFCTLYIWAEGI